MSVSEVPQSLPVQKMKETFRRDQNESWEENSATKESTVRLKSNNMMMGEEPHFGIHRQIVNNK